jgi:hypothetical protein
LLKEITAALAEPSGGCITAFQNPDGFAFDFSPVLAGKVDNGMARGL